ncbi:MAG TPA: ABC transporter ATP-binding protein, partial [Isosphaeraceae bacterium]
MKTVARLLRYTLRHRARLVFATMLSLAGVAVELARPWPMKVVVDHVLGGRPLPAAASAVARWLPGADTPRGLLAWSLATALALAVGGAAVMMASISVGVAVCQGLVFDLLRDLFGKLQRLSVAYHGRQKVGDLLQRVSGDVLVVFLAVTQVALPALTSSLTIVGMAVIMVRLDAGLALVALAIFPMMAGALVVFAKPLRGSSTRQQACQGALLALVEQSLSAVRMIQGFARESFIQRKVEAGALELAEAGGAAARVAAASGQVIAGASGAVAVAVLGIGATRVIDGRLTIGDLLVFVGYVAALSAPVLALGTSIAYGVAVAARSRRVFEILDCPEEVAERPDAPELGRARGEVVFEAVSFGYDGGAGAPVLRDVSFRAEPGTVTAVVGTTGAGKSSLVGLISRFYDPWRGRVLIDGHDARDVSLRSLREN